MSMLVHNLGIIMSDYHIFKKTVKSGNKKIQRWYYWFYDPVTGKQKNKVCKNCKTKQAAALYIAQLPKLNKHKSLIIKDFASDMFDENSDFMQLKNKLGKSYSNNTLHAYQVYLADFILNYGDYSLENLKVKDVIDFLYKKNKSAGYKNTYLAVIREVYKYANYLGQEVFMPKFPNFKKDGKKSDVFTLNELAQLLQPENFDFEVFYIFSVFVFCTGLRNGEACAFRPCQFVPGKNAIIIDGFISNDGTRTNYNKTGNNENLRWRVVPLPDSVCNLLQNYAKQTKCKDDDLLFKFDGKTITTIISLYYFRKAIRKTKIKPNGRKLTIHSLRYSYVTHLRPYLSGDRVQKIVGHNNIKMTDYYTRAELEAAVADFDEILPVVNDFFKKLEKQQ